MNLFRIFLKSITPDPYKIKMEEFDRRIQQARKAHKPVRHIMAERRAWVHENLRGK